MTWLHVYSNDAQGNRTFGSLPDLLEDIRDGADVGVVHQGEIVRRFFPVQQVLIRDAHVYAVVHATIHNVVPDKEGAIKWETLPNGMTVVYCSNGTEYWKRRPERRAHAPRLVFAHGEDRQTQVPSRFHRSSR